MPILLLLIFKYEEINYDTHCRLSTWTPATEWALFRKVLVIINYGCGSILLSCFFCDFSAINVNSLKILYLEGLAFFFNGVIFECHYTANSAFVFI